MIHWRDENCNSIAWYSCGGCDRNFSRAQFEVINLCILFEKEHLIISIEFRENFIAIQRNANSPESAASSGSRQTQQEPSCATIVEFPVPLTGYFCAVLCLARTRACHRSSRGASCFPRTYFCCPSLFVF